MADNDQGSKKSRQKIIIIILVVVAGFVVWQMFGMFGGSSTQPEKTKMAGGAPPPPPMPTPKPAELPAPAPLTQREMELMQLQQDTEAKYVAAVNELQMLKVQRDIAQTNKDIAGAKLDTVNAQKNIVSLLTPETNNNYAQRLTNLTQGAPTGSENGGPPIPIVETTYTVISVTEIQGQWAAVIGVQGKLYNVHIGDVLPADNSKVVSINRSGVVLLKGDVKRTVSLVPII